MPKYWLVKTEEDVYPIEELKKLGEEGKEKKDEAEEAELSVIRKRHGVK